MKPNQMLPLRPLNHPIPHPPRASSLRPLALTKSHARQHTSCTVDNFPLNGIVVVWIARCVGVWCPGTMALDARGRSARMRARRRRGSPASSIVGLGSIRRDAPRLPTNGHVLHVSSPTRCLSRLWGSLKRLGCPRPWRGRQRGSQRVRGLPRPSPVFVSSRSATRAVNAAASRRSRATPRRRSGGGSGG